MLKNRQKRAKNGQFEGNFGKKAVNFEQIHHEARKIEDGISVVNKSLTRT
jgi:hypothetical protein